MQSLKKIHARAQMKVSLLIEHNVKTAETLITRRFLGLYGLPMTHKKDARRIWVNVSRNVYTNIAIFKI